MIDNLREGLTKNINKIGGVFHGGGSTHSTEINYFDNKINTSQTDPNALKREINQEKYFGICEPHH